MADPITWTFLAAIETCLQAITTAGGYHTDAGQHVTREPHAIPDDDQGALIALALELKQPATDPALRRTHRFVTALLVAKVDYSDPETAQLRLHELIDDVERALDQRQAVFPAGVQYPVFVEAKPIQPAEGVTWIGAEVRVAAHVPKR